MLNLNAGLVIGNQLKWRNKMGQAKLRGTFEERKAQAIAAGRIKVKYSKGSKVEEQLMLQVLRELFKGHR